MPNRGDLERRSATAERSWTRTRRLARVVQIRALYEWRGIRAGQRRSVSKDSRLLDVSSRFALRERLPCPLSGTPSLGAVTTRAALSAPTFCAGTARRVVPQQARANQPPRVPQRPMAAMYVPLVRVLIELRGNTIDEIVVRQDG
jgi:hypothetical protein